MVLEAGAAGVDAVLRLEVVPKREAVPVVEVDEKVVLDAVAVVGLEAGIAEA